MKKIKTIATKKRATTISNPLASLIKGKMQLNKDGS
jgi:hypothetical protein